MKLKELVKQYKTIANEMKKEAKNYNNLCYSVSCGCSNKTFKSYKESWKRLISLNEEAYRVMYEYRKLSGSAFYRFLFFCGILPKQNTFRFIDESKTRFNCVLLINLLNLK